MVALVIVVLDERCDLCFQITGQIIVLQQALTADSLDLRLGGSGRVRSGTLRED
jgi:hypothetical protein